MLEVVGVVVKDTVEEVVFEGVQVTLRVGVGDKLRVLEGVELEDWVGVRALVGVDVNVVVLEGVGERVRVREAERLAVAVEDIQIDEPCVDVVPDGQRVQLESPDKE